MSYVAEAAELANLIFEQAERKPITDEVRNRIASRASGLRLESIKPYFGSLERDPVHPSAYYLAVDAGAEPLLLHLALATAATSSVFHKALLVGRMRRANGPELIINSVPFGPFDQEAIEKFCARIGAAVLPRPQGLRAAISVSSDHPETALPAALDAFRSVWKRTGRNMASFGPPATDGSSRDFYFAGLWSAIRAGWRDGYNAAVEVAISMEPFEAVKETVRQAAGYSTFGADPGGLFHLEADPRHPAAWSDAAIEEQFERCFTADERGWIIDEFVRSFDTGDAIYEFAAPDVLRLAVKFGPSLRTVEQLHEAIRQTRSVQKAGRSFDFELLLEQAGFPSTPRELIFCLEWLKQRGHVAQLVAPLLDAGQDLGLQLKLLAGIARHYQAKLSLHSRADHTSEVLDLIALATAGRIHYKLSGDGEAVASRVQSLAAHLG